MNPNARRRRTPATLSTTENTTMTEDTERAEGEDADEAEEEEQQQPRRVIRVAAATMTGDLLRALVEEMRRQSKPWQALTSTQQEAVIERFHSEVGRAIVNAVKIIAGDGRAAIVAKLEQAVIKDGGIKAQLSLAQNDPGRHDLTDAVGKQVLLSVVDVSPYRGGERPEPDAGPAGQQDLPLGEAAAGALDALDAGIAAADTPTDADGEETPETPAEPVWRRDDGRLYDAILLIPPDWTGIAGENTEDDLAQLAGWSDEAVRAAEEFCAAVANLEEGHGSIRDLPERPAVLGGPLPMPAAVDDDEPEPDDEGEEEAEDAGDDVDPDAEPL